MNKTNFIDVIKTFEKDEFKNFIDYVNSPYFNSNNSVIKLMDVVKKYYPDFDNRNFTKEKVYQKIYSSTSYNDQVMRNLMSDALQLAYGFLVIKNEKENKAQNSLTLLSELRTRKLDTLYEKNLKSFTKLLNEEHTIDFRYFEWLYKLESEIFLNEIVHNRQEEVYPTIIKQSEFLTHDYLSKLINHLIDMSINERYFNVQESSGLAKEIFFSIGIEKLLERLKESSQKEYSILSVFYYRAMTILKGDVNYYEMFKKLFFENAFMFSRGTNFVLVTSLETFCINNIKKDPGKYRTELHEIHLKSIDLNILKMEGSDYLSLMRFWNIFINSTEVGKTDWAEKFAMENYVHLEPDVKDSALNYAMGIIDYERKDYDKALERLNKVRLQQYLFKLGVRSIYLRLYYEKGDLESASSALDSYKQFLYKNKKISESHRESYMNFASIYYDLLRYKSGEKTLNLSDLEHKITTAQNIYGKKWLLEQFKNF